MKNIYRRGFVKGSGVLFLSVGGMIMLAIFAYIAFLILKGLINTTIEGWYALGYIAIIFIGFYVIAFLINKLLKKYKSKYGEKAKANVEALSVTMDAIVVGFCAAMAVKAFYQDRLDNVVMWSGLIAFNLYNIFKQSMQKVING